MTFLSDRKTISANDNITRYFENISILVAILLFLQITTFPSISYAQSYTLPVTLINSNGLTPSLSGNNNTNIRQGTTYDAKNQMIYLLFNDMLWRYSLATDTWLNPDTLSLDKNINCIAYDTVNNRLLIWDRGIGRVYVRKNDGSIHRIDHSFEQKNQFGHLAWVDPQTTNIYAFGGYGLFSFKNFITYYDQNAHEWNLLRTPHSKILPTPQENTTGIFDYKNRSLWMIGSSSYTIGRRIQTSQISNERALWKFNLQTKEWSRFLVLPHDISDIQNGLFNTNKCYLSYIPRLHWAVFPMVDRNKSVGADGGQQFLAVFDSSTNTFSTLPIQNDSLPEHLIILNMIWVKEQQSLYLLGWRFLSNQQRDEAVIYKIPFNNIPAIYTYLSNHNLGLASTASIMKNHREPVYPKLFFYMLIGLFFGATVSYIYFRKYPSKIVTATDNIPDATRRYSFSDNSITADNKNELLRISIFLKEKPIIRIGEHEINTDIPTKELELLILLAQRSLNNKPYVLTDDVDQNLWPDYNNPDYVRKLRNKAIERLEKIFQQNETLTDGEHFICRRNYAHDNRKIEYYLNFKYFKIST
jgi:hypothetical protein